VARLRVAVCLSLLAAAAACVGGLAVAASPAGLSVRDLVGVNFVSACAFSHRAADDPIVYPGQPGR
jgi:hypothetical protein